MDDVALEQLDPLTDRHVGQFGRREIGEGLAGGVDRGPLLLLEDRLRDVANGDDRPRSGGDVGRHERGGGVDGIESVRTRPEDDGMRPARRRASRQAVSSAGRGSEAGPASAVRKSRPRRSPIPHQPVSRSLAHWIEAPDSSTATPSGRCSTTSWSRCRAAGESTDPSSNSVTSRPPSHARRPSHGV